VPSLHPSFPLVSRPRHSAPGLPKKLISQKSNGKDEALGQNEIFDPSFPHLPPTIPSAKAWGCKLSPEMGAEGGAGERRGRYGCFLSPSLYLPGLRAGSPGQWCLKLTDLPCPSCLLGEGLGRA
jgi:hypothetical protein